MRKSKNNIGNLIIKVIWESFALVMIVVIFIGIASVVYYSNNKILGFTYAKFTAYCKSIGYENYAPVEQYCYRDNLAFSRERGYEREVYYLTEEEINQCLN
jgi:hypothetical protein